LRKLIGIGAIGVCGLLALGRFVSFSWLFSTANYLPHQFCYLAQPGLVWTNAVADGLIAISYALLFGCLFWLTAKMRHATVLHPYLWIFIGFGSFILACGITHAMEIVTIWWPVYPLAAAFKVACAAVSVATVFLFTRATPVLSRSMLEVLDSLARAKQETEDEAFSYRGEIEAISRSQMMIEFHMDGTIIKANANYLRVFGWQDIELAGKHHSVFITESYKQSGEYRTFWQELRAGRYQAGLFSRIDKRGNEVWIEASYNPILGPDGVPIKIVKFASNVTERVLSQNDLKDAEGRLQAILDNVLDGIITIDGSGTITSVNLAAVRIFGHPVEEVVGRNIKMLMPEPDRSGHDDHLARYRPEGDTSFTRNGLGSESNTPPPKPASVLTGRRVLLVEDDEVSRFLAEELLTDLGIHVTTAINGREGVERVNAEPFDLALMDIEMPVMDGITATRLIRADRRFQSLPIIAMTAHALSGDRERSLDAGMNDHLTEPIDPKVLEETLLRWMNGRSAVQPTIDTQSTAAGASPDDIPEQLPPFDIPAALQRANGKPPLLRKMLLSFRHQFMGAPSELRQLIAEGKTEEAGRVAHSLKGAAASLEAKDLATAAAGLENAIREGVIADLNALIENMETALEPAIAAAGSLDRRVAPPASTPEGPAGKSDMTILLVDDQSGYLDLLKDVFGSHTEVLYASDGLAALRIAAARVPDLILLDVMMAGLDGYEVFRRLKAAPVTRDIPVIFLTGLGSVAEETKGLAMGAADYVTKPINPVAVRTRVTHQIELRRANQALMRLTAEEHAAQLAKEEQRATEVERISQQALQLRDDFLSHVSHELRSPLTSIYSFSSIIADGLAGRTTHEQDEYLLIIQKNVRQLQSMIEDLLAVTASKTGKLAVMPQDTSLSEAILDAVHTCEANAREKGVNLSCVIPPLLASAFADPIRLLQVLIILCDNAIKFTPAGGSVKVQAGVFKKVPGYLLVEVSDTGCGIKPELLERIFEHHYQVTDSSRDGRKGLGLGLHIAKELTTRQGGAIWATSAQGAGSVFSFTLPVFVGQRSEEPVSA